MPTSAGTSRLCSPIIGAYLRTDAGLLVEHPEYVGVGHLPGVGVRATTAWGSRRPRYDILEL
jgi:hypothetical protein